MSASFAVAGWVVGVPWLGLGDIGFRSTSAICILLLSLVVGARIVGADLPEVPRRLLVGTVGALAALSLLQWVGELASLTGPAPIGVLPERMALMTALAVLLLVAALVLGVEKAGRRKVGDACTTVALAMAAVVLFGDAIGTPVSPAMGSGVSMHLATAGMLALLALAMLLADSRSTLAGVVLDDGAGAWAARRLLPLLVLVAAFVETLRHQAVAAAIVDAEAAGMLATFGAAGLSAVVVLLGARSLASHEERLRRLQHSSFISVLEHELRTPLVVVRNLGTLIDERWHDVPEEERRRALRTISEQAERLLRLVRETALASSLVDGSATPKPIRVCVSDALLEAASRYDVEYRVLCDRELAAQADPEHVSLIVGTALAHARRHRLAPVEFSAVPAGEHVDIRIRYSLGDDDGVTRGRRHRNDRRPAHDGDGSLWLLAELARLSGGAAAYERDDEGRLLLRVMLPAAAAGETRP